jgi:4a-hydroxytetrahydrobiopterin dehydratase
LLTTGRSGQGEGMAQATLTADEIATALKALPDWSGGPTGITRSFEAATFPDGIALVQQVADAAEAADHHPDIDIRWRTVTFRLVTHSAGGVTAKDIAMARTIDTVIAAGWSG